MVLVDGINERFNHTVREDFADYEEAALVEDLRLLSHLDRCNGQRPHRSLNNRPSAGCLPDTCPIISNVIAPYAAFIV